MASLKVMFPQISVTSNSSHVVGRKWDSLIWLFCCFFHFNVVMKEEAGKMQWDRKSINRTTHEKGQVFYEILTLEMFNVEPNSGNCYCFTIIFVLEKAHDGRFSRVVQPDDENADLLMPPIFSQNFQKRSSENHFHLVNIAFKFKQ